MSRALKEISSGVGMPRTVENINPPEEITSDADAFARHRQDLHDELGVVEARRALKGYTRGLEISVLDRGDPESEIDQTRSLVCRVLETEMEDMGGIKFAEMLKIKLRKEKDDGDFLFKDVDFGSKAAVAIDRSHLKSLTIVGDKNMLNLYESWTSEGSGWVIDSIISHYLNVVAYSPLQGSSYVELPPELRNSAKGVINIQNSDNECFRWCHTRYLNPQNKHPERIKKTDKALLPTLDYTGVKFPVESRQYSKVESQNSIRINVFGYESGQTYPIYVSEKNHERCMNLLLINRHYVLIKDFNKFMYLKTKHKERKHFCMHCLQCFSSGSILSAHSGNCIAVNGKQAIKMPKEGDNTLTFINHHKQLEVPFVIYADFEAVVAHNNAPSPDDRSSYTQEYQKHIDCGFAYKVVCCVDDSFSKPVKVYRGENAVYKFMKKMLKEVDHCQSVKEKFFNKDMSMTKSEMDEHEKSTECHICNRSYADSDIRVRDHCHITGNIGDQPTANVI